MKRIAIFCDGTWNRHDAEVPTHVVRLAQSVPTVGTDGILQVPIYLPGVGIGQGVTRTSRFTDRVFGGAFGWGLDDRIQEAYRHLIFLHDPGDEIYIFGFSRGAYTARSLAGLIRTMGIPPTDRTDLIPEAMELYRKRADRDARVKGIRTFTDDPLENLPPYPHPDSAIMMHERAKLSPETPTSRTEVLWRERQGMAKHPRLRITYLGVWDTVGALGLPGFLGLVSKITNHRYAFHDADLSSSVVAARHAVAIDERRRHFPPALWRNLDELNAKAGTLNYLQQWFPGNHRILGGGGTVPELSAFSTEWIAAGAAAQGLTFDADRLGALTGMKKATVSDEGAPQRPALNNLFGFMLADRELLIAEGDEEPRVDQVSDAARERVRRMAWRPPPLLPIIDDLN